jgi:hypothetical protein
MGGRQTIPPLFIGLRHLIGFQFLMVHIGFLGWILITQRVHAWI